MIRILVDSSADYTAEEILTLGLDFVPITISLGENDYLDGINLTKDQLYEALENDSSLFPKTSQPSPAEFLNIFEDVKKKGDEIICIMLSSKLSGTYQSAVLAKNIVDYDKIYIIDSRTATCGTRLLVDHVRKLRLENIPAIKIAESLEELKSRIRVYAGVDTLEYLCRGGRLSHTAATIGELANLKPILTIQNGTVEVLGKCLGRIKAANYVLDILKGKEIDTDYPFYTIYSYGTDNLEKLESKLEKEGYPVASSHQLGAAIGSHVGPGCFGVVFIEK